MGDIAARRETSLTALAAVLGNDMRSEKLWMRRWQTFGITHPHNPCQKTMISGLDGLMAQAARRYAQYESAGWATAAEWASVGGETDDTALGLVLVANTHRCCDDYYCENNSCGQPKQLHLSHRTVINRSQLTNTIDLAEPPDRIPNWTTEKIINLYDGLADDWMFTTNACMSNGKTVHSPSLKHCENTAEFNSNATRAHIMWCLPRCQQTNKPTVGRTGLEYELACELATLFTANKLGFECVPAGWPTFRQWPNALQSPTGWTILASTATVALAAASYLTQTITGKNI